MKKMKKIFKKKRAVKTEGTNNANHIIIDEIKKIVTNAY